MILLKDSLVNSQSYAFTQKADISQKHSFEKMDSFIHPSATPTHKKQTCPIQSRTFSSLLATKRTLPQQQENPKRTSIFKNKM